MPGINGPLFQSDHVKTHVHRSRPCRRFEWLKLEKHIKRAAVLIGRMAEGARFANTDVLLIGVCLFLFRFMSGILKRH